MQPLTQRMQPIIDAIGFDATITLVAALGGTRVYLSRSPDSPVARAIGADHHAVLLHEIGAGPLDVPRCLNWVLARRNEEIIARSLAGETQDELARRFRLTDRHIRRILQTETQVPT